MRNRILLIHYSESVQCKTVDTINDPYDINDYSEFCDPYVGIIDDFSEYFYNKKVFYADKKLNMNDSTFLLLWEYGCIRNVIKFPFQYSKISIDTILSDSSLKIKFKNINKIISPKNIYKDSIIETKLIDSKMTLLKTIFTIENIGLVNKTSIIDWSNVEYEKSGALIEKLRTEDIMLRFPGGYDSLQSYLNNKVNYPEEAVTKKIKGTVLVQVTIDPNGIIKDTKLIKGVDPKLDEEAIRLLKNMPNWLSSDSYYKGDMSIIIPISFAR